MTLLLGNPNCLDSLRKDVTEVQGTIIDVFSRVGAVRYPSWKFPDKTSCELDLVSLMECYDYFEDDLEYTQHSHIMLFELVIDRLVLLLQSITHYADILITEQNIPISKSRGPCMSVGLVVKRYWNSMLQLGQLYQQKRFSKEDRSKVRSELIVPEAQSDHFTRCQLAVPKQPSASIGVTKGSASSRGASVKFPAPDIAKGTRSVGLQTMESSLVPCDACARTQATLKDVGSSIMAVCHQQNLPSSLGRFRAVVSEALGEGTLSATDVAYWACEQNKDLARINKHLAELTGRVEPLKAELRVSAEQQGQLQERIRSLERELERERGRQELMERECECRVEEVNSRNARTVATLESEKEELRRGSAALEERVSILKEELKEQHALIRDLELVKAALLEEVRTQKTDESLVLSLEERVRELTAQLESAGSQLNTVGSELDKERAKIDSLLRHEESLKEKQNALLEHVDQLDKECESLRTSLAESEEGMAELQERLDTVSAERDKQQQEVLELVQTKQINQGSEKAVAELMRRVSELERQTEDHKEQQRLLVMFPELNVPAEAQCTGDITLDMEKQLEANGLRIRVLEEENSHLRTTLAKLRESAQQGALKLIPQTQLWAASGVPANGSKYEGRKEHSPPVGPRRAIGSPDLEASAGLGQRPCSEKKARIPSADWIRRPGSSVFINPPEPSAIRAYARLKSAGTLPVIRTGTKSNYRKLH
ncbi:coiled-coil domain-containing protein 157 isoform X2 [Callorhinchus milii]|uniref:coiled-coil domain-containing protein 157 isoform X2 n=1 Tax=Callorhinchus milii TaxID=7868 RepID=UPI000457569F|nr:coiled-coil domain-containing protein 157 isoform X2 [Callorhinchus milii]|eukprot:gi/632968319/ref/XP_007900461.1/ PREDICTED: coiled-coil domain-containing protein 157 isoform X2 [Callorhinchus milii]